MNNGPAGAVQVDYDGVREVRKLDLQATNVLKLVFPNVGDSILHNRFDTHFINFRPRYYEVYR
jgi:hypothetical protein